jgi:hypothetical protein
MGGPGWGKRLFFLGHEGPPWAWGGDSAPTIPGKSGQGGPWVLAGGSGGRLLTVGSGGSQGVGPWGGGALPLKPKQGIAGRGGWPALALP